ncbi:MAG TPA: hypothetical protein V6D22_12940 [Candidatus Obscuribacterales bacterium]
MQARRIGQPETAEWQELYEFYLGLERRERRQSVRTLALAIFCVPVVMSLLSVML